MQNKELKEREDLLSLNSVLTEFDLQELEERLETDPLAVGGLVELSTTQDLSRSVQLMDDCECNFCLTGNNR